MKYFYLFAVWYMEMTIAIAEAVPVRNTRYIGELREELWYWKKLLDRELIQF